MTGDHGQTNQRHCGAFDHAAHAPGHVTIICVVCVCACAHTYMCVHESCLPNVGFSNGWANPATFV